MVKGPFRADHVGSLLRPPELLEAREQFKNGEMDAGGLREVEDRLIRRAVKLEEETGIQSVTDGDYRRESWSNDFLDAIEGVKSASPPAQRSDDHHTTEVGGVVTTFKLPAPTTHGKLGWPADGIQRGSFNFLKGETSRTPKVTMPSVSMLHFRGGRGGVSEDAYPDMEEFFADASGIWRAEILDLAAQGCRYVQLDDTNLAYLCDDRLRENVRGLGEDPDELPHLYARLINDAIAGRPDDMAVTIHLCRGNSFSRGHAKGGYEHVAEAIFNEVEVDGFFLEYDDERSGGFEPLRFVPKGPGGPRIVLGIVTSKFGELEDKDGLKRRLDEAARYMPPEQMCLSPQCGFASHTGGNLLSEEQQWAKLRHCVEVAEEVWGTAI